MAVVFMATYPILNKQVVSLFLSRASLEVKSKQKMPKSPRTSTPGERKALRSKAFREVILLITINAFNCSPTINAFQSDN